MDDRVHAFGHLEDGLGIGEIADYRFLIGLEVFDLHTVRDADAAGQRRQPPPELRAKTAGGAGQENCVEMRVHRAASAGSRAATARPDRKSTRLNSSHVKISYAVFCL